MGIKFLNCTFDVGHISKHGLFLNKSEKSDNTHLVYF